MVVFYIGAKKDLANLRWHSFHSLIFT